MINNNQISKAKEAVILARVSSAEQENGKSLDAQIELCQEYAERNNLRIIQTYALVESSTKGDRKKFQQMMDFVCQQRGPIAIIAHTVDRFQRRYNESVETEPLIRDGQIELHFVSNGLIINKENYDEESSIWDFNVLGAKYYVQRIRINTKRGINKKIADQEYPGLAPLGYKNISNPTNIKKRTIVIDENEAVAIKKLFEWYASGLDSVSTITSKLNAMGFRTHEGAPYNANTLWVALQNPFYYGMMKIKGNLYPHIHGALISKELFDKCQEVRLGYKKEHHNYGCKEFLFRGQIHCGECGNLISPYTKTKVLKCGRKLTFNYLSCSHKKNKADGHRCDCKQINEKVAIEAVSKALQKITLNPKMAQAIANHLSEMVDHNVEFKKQQETSIKNRLSNITTERNSLFAMNASGAIDSKYLQDRLLKLKEEEASLKSQQMDASLKEERAKITFEKVLNVMSVVGDLFKKGSRIETKRAILNLVFSNLLLKQKNIEIIYKKPFQLLLEGSKCCIWGANQLPVPHFYPNPAKKIDYSLC